MSGPIRNLKHQPVSWLPISPGALTTTRGLALEMKITFCGAPEYNLRGKHIRFSSFFFFRIPLFRFSHPGGVFSAGHSMNKNHALAVY